MRRVSVLVAVAVSISATLVGCGQGGARTVALPDPGPLPPPAGLSTGPEACIGGSAGEFSCLGISLRKRVSLETMNGTAGNDIWGWVDTQSGNEYALM